MLSHPRTHWDDADLYGLLGNPVRKSLSALMHNANFQAMGMNAAYYPLLLEEAHLPMAMQALEVFKYKGLNVTMPFKKAVIPFLDSLDEMAELCGAVNTIAIRDGKTIGTNTDGTGFVHSLKEQGSFDPASRCCVLLGAGGAGRGISFALARAGAARIVLLDIPESRDLLEQLVSDLNAYKTGVAEGKLLSPETMRAALKDADVVINATSVGMAPKDDACPFDTEMLEERHVVCDIVYLPSRTRLLDRARMRGCVTLEGYWMLIWQGVEAFRFWTGKEPDVDAFKNAVLQSVL